MHRERPLAECCREATRGNVSRERPRGEPHDIRRIAGKGRGRTSGPGGYHGIRGLGDDADALNREGASPGDLIGSLRCRCQSRDALRAGCRDDIRRFRDSSGSGDRLASSPSNGISRLDDCGYTTASG